MKKTYTKPDIMFEDFSLSTNISAGCEVRANAVEGACGYTIQPWPGKYSVLFIEGNTGCTTKVPASQEYTSNTNDTFCYHNPSEAHNLFSS